MNALANINKPFLSIQRVGPILQPLIFRDTKDPCPLFDGKIWHLYGSVGSSLVEKWEIFHATALTINGPWKENEPAIVKLENPHVAAPGMVYDFAEHMFHMFVQTDCFALGGTVEHLISSDGHRFNNFGTIISTIPHSPEACIYDPHPAIVNGQRYITYSGAPAVGRPDIYIAQSMSDSWYGPWKKLGPILTHEQVLHHNQHDHPDYEWGLEGPQLIELPNGKILLNCVCFLPEGPRGTRQRIFFAIADSVMGPYQSLGPIMTPQLNSWEDGENGHAAGLIQLDTLYLFYQARTSAHMSPWRYGQATIGVREIESAITYLL